MESPLIRCAINIYWGNETIRTINLDPYNHLNSIRNRAKQKKTIRNHHINAKWTEALLKFSLHFGITSASVCSRNFWQIDIARLFSVLIELSSAYQFVLAHLVSIVSYCSVCLNRFRNLHWSFLFGSTSFGIAFAAGMCHIM